MKKVIAITAVVLVAIGIFGFTISESNKDNGLSTMKADHLLLGVTNFDETVKWYKEILGFEIEVR